MDAARLKAAGFSDQEIRLHQAGFSDAEIQAHTSAAPPPPTDTVGSNLARVLDVPHDIMAAGRTFKGVWDSVGEAGAHPLQTWHHLTTDLPDQAIDIAKGGLQRLREMSPDDQGTAPKMDTKAYDKFAGENYDKYGTPLNAARTIGENPTNAILAAAQVGIPALRAVGAFDAAGGAAAAAGRRVARIPAVAKAREFASAGRTSEAAAAAMDADTGARVASSRDVTQSDADAALARATKTAESVARGRVQAKALNARSVEAAASATSPELDVGAAAHRSDIGDPVRAAADARQTALDEGMKAADAKYRAAMDKVVADRSAAGVGVSDSNIAKAMIRQSRKLVEPDVALRPEVGNVLADSAGGKLHRELLDTLAPSDMPLSAAEAVRATKAGYEVKTAKDGSLFRTVKPSFKDVDDLRRKVGKIAQGDMVGYEAINRGEASAMYANLTKVLDKYTQGASAPVQANWRMGKAALAPYEKVRAGQNIVGTQAGTDVASVPASGIVGRMMAGGRDTLKQTAAVAGDAPVATALRSHVQNELAGKNATQLEAAIAPGTQLGEAINTDSALQAAVRDHIARTRAAEQAGAQSVDLARRAKLTTDRSDFLDKAATALQDRGMKATVKARGYQQELSELNVMTDPKDVGPKYLEVLKRAHSEGNISNEQLEQGMALAKRAETSFKQKATRDAWMRNALFTVGAVPAGAALGLSAPVAITAGIGLGLGSHVARKGLRAIVTRPR